MPRLIVIKGADEGKQFELTGAVLGIGRDSTSTIRLHDTEVSRKHAELRHTANGYRLVDAGSANGSFINNQSIKDVLLQPGDHLQIGQTILVYSDPRGEKAGPSDLASHISMITRADVELASAIVKTVSEAEGSRILARPDQVKGAWLKTRLANLGIMYETIQAVSHILDLDQLLDKIMELIFNSIEADRGCVMMRNSETGQFEPRALRWRQPAPKEDKIAVSRTIMDYVWNEKKGVLVADAMRDDRFSAGRSIVQSGIREVICVPIKGRHETLGVLYLDTTRTARELADTGENKFTEDHLSLAIAIAHQAALAIEDTRYQQALVQAERLAAIGQTIAALSHHIKNILQGLRSGGDIVRMGLEQKNDTLLHQGWKIVEKNQGKIYDLVMDMLSFSKEREPAIEETDVNSIVKEVIDLVENRVKELGIHLDKRLAELPRAEVDSEGLHRSLLNIIGNACDAVEECQQPHVVVETKLDPKGESILVVVEDNGPGIAPEKLQDIFKPFVSSKGARGTGLGLPVSRKILREHAGDLIVESEPGKGSCFTLSFPIKSPLAADMSRTQAGLPLAPPTEY